MGDRLGVALLSVIADGGIPDNVTTIELSPSGEWLRNVYYPR